MIEVKVNVNDEVSPSIKRIIETLDGEKRANANEGGGRAANTAAINYHKEFNTRKGWRGKNYLNGPGRTQGDFGQNVALGWNFRTSDKEGATISNNADYYAFKVSGGVIRPKRAKALTIPMIPDAAGQRVRDYESATGHKLFRVLGKKALFEKIEGGGIRAVYALVKRAIHKPWPEALPDSNGLAAKFAAGFLGTIKDDL